MFDSNGLNRARYIFFTSLAKITIQLNDSDIAEVSVRSIGVSSGLQSSADSALSRKGNKINKESRFVQRTDKLAITPGQLMGRYPLQKTRKDTKSVSNIRANAIFINKFTRHGMGARSAKGYAKAVSGILRFYRELPETADKLGLYAAWYYSLHSAGKLYSISGRRLIANAAVSYSSAQLNVAAMKKIHAAVFYSRYSLLNTELIYKHLLDLAPMYYVKISRIPKARYKNIRDKTGRYEAKVLPVTPGRQVPCMFKYMKYTWKFSGARGYTAKYASTLFNAIVSPGETLGYVVCKKAYAKWLTR